MSFTPEFLLLLQEGHLIHSCLTNGLTELRSAHANNKGAFYSASFNISIGLERLLKAIVIIDHMVCHELSVPTKRELKAYGHNITELYSKVSLIGEKMESPIIPIDNFDAPNEKLLALLSDFSTRSRYHNLDALSDNTINQKDPLELWNEVILEVLVSDARPSSINRILSRSVALGKEMESCSIPLMQGLDKESLNMAGVLALPALHELAVKYIVYRIIVLISPIRDLIGTLSHLAYSINTPSPAFPQMHEFLEWVWDDRSYCMRKKIWP